MIVVAVSRVKPDQQNARVTDRPLNKDREKKVHRRGGGEGARR